MHCEAEWPDKVAPLLTSGNGNCESIDTVVSSADVDSFSRVRENSEMERTISMINKNHQNIEYINNIVYIYIYMYVYMFLANVHHPTPTAL